MNVCHVFKLCMVTALTAIGTGYFIEEERT